MRVIRIRKVFRLFWYSKGMMAVNRAVIFNECINDYIIKAVMGLPLMYESPESE